MSEMTASEAAEYWVKRGGPAFPYPDHRQGTRGMTLRDYFASRALVGLITVPNGDILTGDKIAKHAYHLADAMLREREVSR